MQVFHETLDTFVAETHRYNMWRNLAWPIWKIDGITPIHIAAKTGLAQFAKHILSKGEAMDGKSAGLAVELAASYNHGDVIQVLVDHGADPDYELSEGLSQCI
jgi:ankyrin repeat protein